MNNFESPTNQELPPESGSESKGKGEQLGGKESERRNLFERIYKSKTARILAFAATLGIGAKLLFEKQEQFNQPSTHYELGENNRLDLGELEKKFSSKAEIPNTENRYILHIAQTHGDNNLDGSIGLMKMIDKDLDYLIEKQREIEDLLILLSEKYQVKDVFVEGIDKTVIDLIEQIKSDIAQSQDGGKKSPIDQWNTALNISFYCKNKQEGITDAQRAYFLYLAQNTIRNVREDLSQKYKYYQTGNGDVPQEYQTLFTSWKQQGISFDEIMTRLNKHEKEIATHELLKDNRIYIWGGAMKLYLEGKVNVHPAETIEANKESFAKYPGGAMTFTEGQLKDPKELEKFRKIIEERMSQDERGHNIREDAAIDLITQSPISQSLQFYPLVYGLTHDFKDNIEKHNEQGQHDIGLIRIEPRN